MHMGELFDSIKEQYDSSNLNSQNLLIADYLSNPKSDKYHIGLEITELISKRKDIPIPREQKDRELSNRIDFNIKRIILNVIGDFENHINFSDYTALMELALEARNNKAFKNSSLYLDLNERLKSLDDRVATIQAQVYMQIQYGNSEDLHESDTPPIDE